MKLISLKILAYFTFLILSTAGFAHAELLNSKFNTNFSIEKLILGKWELEDAKTISLDSQDTSQVSTENQDLKCLDFFSKEKGLFDEYFSNKLYPRLPGLALLSYQLESNKLTDELRLVIFEKGDSVVFRNFQIEEFTYNRLVLASYSGQNDNDKSEKKQLTYQRPGKDGQVRSVGVWLHYGAFGIYNLEDTDSLEHKFYRVEKDQDIRDSLEIGDITFQLELLTDGTYFAFCTGGVLGSVNLGKYRIDLLKQKLYFFENDLLVYDYYFNSDSELVLYLSSDSAPVDN